MQIMIDNQAAIEVFMAACTVANFIIQLRVRQAVIELELKITQRFLSKMDFAQWTRKTPSVPTFVHEGESK